jgi:hypothetical protein
MKIKMSLVCRNCGDKTNGLQAGLCNECVGKVSYKVYWNCKTDEEAVKLYFLQRLNNERKEDSLPPLDTLPIGHFKNIPEEFISKVGKAINRTERHCKCPKCNSIVSYSEKHKIQYCPDCWITDKEKVIMEKIIRVDYQL